MFSTQSTAKEIQDAHVDTVIIPIGSTEQHGYHLPIGTDTYIAEAIAKRMAEHFGALKLFAVPVTTSQEHRGRKGSAWVSSSTLFQYIGDMMDSLHSQGFKRVILVLAHGGVVISPALTREFNTKYPDMHVVYMNVFQFVKVPDMLSLLEGKKNVHACEMETSIMMYEHPDLLKKEWIEDCVPEVGTKCLDYLSIYKYSPTGVWGMPSLATPEKGKKALEILVRECINFTEDAFQNCFE